MAARQSRVIIAVEEREEGVGRIRMRCVREGDTAGLTVFLQEIVEPGSVICPDNAKMAKLLTACGYAAQASPEAGSRIQLTASLVKRWLNGTHQGRYDDRYLQWYLEEFSFRFNRRDVPDLGSLFVHLLTVATEMTPGEKSC